MIHRFTPIDNYKACLRYGWLLLSSLWLVPNAQAQDVPQAERRMLNDAGEPSLVEFKPAHAYSTAQTQVALVQQLHLTSNDKFTLANRQTDELGFVHAKYQQYFKGVRIEHGVYTVHNRGGVIVSMSGDFSRIPEKLDVQPSVPEASAFRAAVAHVGARRYRWDEAAQKQGTPMRPAGELVVVHSASSGNDQPGPLVLAWKFDIFALEPLSRAYIYVDAHTGRVAQQDAILKHATGTLNTRYSGTQTSNTEYYNGYYRLRDNSRGVAIETFNANRVTDYYMFPNIDFVDNDNNWTAAEHANTNVDNAALDAHWGAQVVYEYWRSVHGRDSYDDNEGAIRSYVHYGVGYDNAAWTGAEMIYGDGGTVFRPVVALDVCAHELGHAVCQYTANFAYTNQESGALNEGYSDIWGAAVENYANQRFAGLNKDAWQIGESIMLNGPALRSLSNPNQFGHPSFYRGQYWDFNNGQHRNSTVLSHWFYLLSVGKTGVNEKGESYSIAGIGIEKAAQIAYRAERIYLYPQSNFSAVRDFTIQATRDLYGWQEEEAVTEAWRAVGVGRPFANTPIAFSGTFGIRASTTAGQYMQISGASAAYGALVVQDNFLYKANCFWQIVGVGNSEYKIVNLNSGLVLEPGNTTMGAAAQQSPYYGYNYQKWTISRIGVPEQGLYKIINSATGYALEVNGGPPLGSAPIVNRTYIGAANQHWHLENQGIYKITNVNSGKALQITTATNGTPLTQGTYSSWTSFNQNWGVATFAGDDNSVAIRRSGVLGLGVVNAGTSAGDAAELQDQDQNTPHNSALEHQRWIIHPLGNGAYKIQNEKSGLVLDVMGGSTADGAPVIQWPWQGGTNQQWLIENVLPTLAPALAPSPATAPPPPAQLTLYPNPAATQVYLTGIATPVRVTVTDLRGSAVSNVQYVRGKLDISNLVPGLYVVTASDGEHEYHQRLVKQ